MNSVSEKYRLLYISIFLFVGQSVFPCQYNVRDMGFVDLEDQPYLLCLYLDSPFTDSDVQNFNRLLQTELQGTNVRGQAIHVTHQKTHPALSWLNETTVVSKPSLLLVNSAGKIYTFPAFDKSKTLEKQIRSTIADILSSPFRETVQEKIVGIFGLVLLVEGQDDGKNEKVRQDALAAIGNIKAAMGTLPKRIARPPEFMTLSRKDLQKEKLFLWAQGLSDDAIIEPSMIIFYGRFRRMGPVLTGDQITAEKITSMLSVIGADCECNLDRSWLQGEMMPAKWDREQLEKLSAQLGFDTEHPMTKIEMSQILRNGNQSNRRNLDFDAIKGLNFGYQEIEVTFDNLEPAREDYGDIVSNSQEDLVSSGDRAQRQPPLEQLEVTGSPQASAERVPMPVVDEDEFKLQNPLYVIGIAGAIVLIVGAYFVISASGKKQ